MMQRALCSHCGLGAPGREASEHAAGVTVEGARFLNPHPQSLLQGGQRVLGIARRGRRGGKPAGATVRAQVVEARGDEEPVCSAVCGGITGWRVHLRLPPVRTQLRRVERGRTQPGGADWDGGAR